MMSQKYKIAYTCYKSYELDGLITTQILEELIDELEEDNYFPWTYDKFGAGPERDPIRVYTTRDALEDVMRSVDFIHRENLPLEDRLANNEIGAWRNIRFFDDS